MCIRDSYIIQFILITKIISGDMWIRNGIGEQYSVTMNTFLLLHPESCPRKRQLREENFCLYIYYTRKLNHWLQIKSYYTSRWDRSLKKGGRVSSDTNIPDSMSTGVGGSNNAEAVSAALILRWTCVGAKCNADEIILWRDLNTCTSSLEGICHWIYVTCSLMLCISVQ